MAIDVAQLYKEEFESVYKYVHFRVRHTQIAEEIVAAVFMKTVEKAHTYKQQRGATERSWLFTIVRNTITDYYRTKKETVSVEAQDITEKSPSLEHKMDIKQHIQTIFDAVNKLPDRQKEIMLLRYKSDLKNTEIAKVLGINQRSVSAALAKATNTLRQTLNLEDL